MGYKRCLFCEQVIDSEAKRCFFCGSELNHVLYHAKSKQQNSYNSLKIEHPVSLAKITLILLLGAALLGMVFLLIR